MLPNLSGLSNSSALTGAVLAEAQIDAELLAFKQDLQRRIAVHLSTVASPAVGANLRMFGTELKKYLEERCNARTLNCSSEDLWQTMCAWCGLTVRYNNVGLMEHCDYLTAKWQSEIVPESWVFLTNSKTRVLEEEQRAKAVATVQALEQKYGAGGPPISDDSNSKSWRDSFDILTLLASDPRRTWDWMTATAVESIAYKNQYMMMKPKWDYWDNGRKGVAGYHHSGNYAIEPKDPRVYFNYSFFIETPKSEYFKESARERSVNPETLKDVVKRWPDKAPAYVLAALQQFLDHCDKGYDDERGQAPGQSWNWGN